MNAEVKKEAAMPREMVTDLLVAGGGGAGLAAALTAAEMGCPNIVVLEKTGSTGGNSALAHDLFGVESPVQKRCGADARRDDFFKIAMRWCHWSKVDPRIVRAFIDKSGDTVRWLLEKGITFELAQYYVNQSPRVRHAIVGRGAQLMKVLAQECRDRKIQVLTHTQASKLLRNADGSIAGVTAARGQEELQIKAKSVIVATGGYAGNPDMLKKYCSYYLPGIMLNQGVRHNTGDGIRLASEIGAATAGLGHIMFHGPHAPSMGVSGARFAVNQGKDNETNVDLSKLVWEPQALWVNKRGRRFIDEGYNLSSFAHANATAQQPGGIMYCLFDDSVRQVMEREGLIRPGAYGIHQAHAGALTAGMPLAGLGEGLRGLAGKYPAWLKIADHWDEIAAWIGTKPETLTKTVAEYNSACQRGFDPVFCKDRNYLLPLASPPYYAILGQSMICDAIGGIKIDEKMEALDGDDNPIPGLFAAGSTTGCWESDSYCYELTGHQLGFALNSGRIAGENAVKYISG